MRIANGWKQYRILDTSQLEKLESWHGVTLVRPDPQIIWKTPKKHPGWKKADGHYSRSSSGGGSWAFAKKLPTSWEMDYERWDSPLRFSHRIQAHRIVSGAGSELGLDGGADSQRRQTDFCTEPVFLYRRRNAGVWPLPGHLSAMWTHPKAWCSGQEKMRRCPV